MLELYMSRDRSTIAAPSSTGKWNLVPIHGTIKFFYSRLKPFYTKFSLKVIISTNLTLIRNVYSLPYLLFCGVVLIWFGIHGLNVRLMKITLHRDGFDLTKLKFSLNSEHSSDKPYLWNLNLIWSKTTLDLKPHWWRWFELTSHQTSWEVLHIHGTQKFFFFYKWLEYKSTNDPS